VLCCFYSMHSSPRLSFYFLVFPFFSYVESLSEASYFYSKQTWEAIVFPFAMSRLSSSTCHYNWELTFSIPIDFDVPSICHAQLALCNRNAFPYVYADCVYIIHCVHPSVTLFVCETNSDKTRVTPNFILGRTTQKKNFNTLLLHAGKPHSLLEFIVTMLLGYVRNCLGWNFAQACL